MSISSRCFLTLCRRMWVARDERDRLFRGNDAEKYLRARRRAAHLEALVLAAVLP